MKLIHLTTSIDKHFAPWRQIGLVCLLLLLGVGQSTAQTFSQIECICQNNDSPQFEGFFQETITITNGGATPWEFLSVSGLYDLSSTPDNLVPIVAGDNIPLTGGTTYEIQAYRLDNTSWEAEVSNGIDTTDLESVNICAYPGPVLLGDSRACLETTDVYSIDNDPALLSGITWSLVGGGTFASPNGLPTMSVDWGDLEGLGQLEVTFTSQAFPGQVSGQCNLTYDLDVTIADEDTTSMACNNALNISMNNSCELFVTPDMILEDQNYPNDSYEVVLRDYLADTIIPSGVISMEYLDKQIEAKIVHECSGNSCWGYIRLEDKSIPDLVCNDDITIDCDELPEPEETGFPVPDDAVVTQIGDGVYSVIGFDKCTELTMRYEDIVQSVHCVGDYSSVISRFWSIMDDAGNTDTCSSRIFILKADLGAITFPENYDDNTGPNPSIKACSGFPMLPNGLPDPYAVGGTGAPQGMFCLNVLVDYEDIKIPKCGDGDVSFKLRRKWIITDLCTADQITQTQSIVVVDDVPPLCKAPAPFTVGTSGTSCGADINVPPVEVTMECSDWDYTVAYKLKDDSGDIYSNATTNGVIRNSDDTYTITNIPDLRDSIWIIYTVTDECGNMSTCFTEAIFMDNLPPVPVCDQNSFVGLNDDGVAWAGWETFDDGSNDNCGIDRIEIMRVGSSACGPNTGFSDKIKFCCDDVGKDIMVSLRVTDNAGNSNTCMVHVEVQDNQVPVLENCPSTITVNCDADLFNLMPYGFPTVIDLCGATIEEEDPIRILDNCGQGTVIRTFVATDKSGNTASCSQTINVQPTNPFKRSDIRWPGDHNITNGCMDSGTAPEDLPFGKQFPTYPEKPCSNVTHDYEDVVFQFTDGACFKILRTWTVLDWCAFDGITNAGVYTHTQVIMVHNNIDPVVEVGCNDEDLEVTDLGDCRSRISITAEGSDDCSLPSSLRWNYKLDIGNDGSVEYDVNSNRINRVIDHGTFRVTWTVTDECDNSSSCSKVFMVDDQKKPTPYCLTELVTVIMKETKEVEIWASDFDRGSTDNCTPQTDLVFSFSSNPNDGFRTFKCEDLIDGELVEELDMYVTDSNGNFDFCTVSIRVQDNTGNCDDTNDRVVLGGKVTNEFDEVVDNINVLLSADLAEFPRVTQLSTSGDYTFDNLIMYTDYNLEAKKEGSYLDGVSTLDLILIQRHILGINDLDSPYKVIASDVNNDERVTASDLVELRKLILGIDAEFKNNTNWKFVDAATEFNNPMKPFPHDTNLLMEGLDHDEMSANFIAVKVGDVNNSHETNLRSEDVDSRSRKEWVLEQSTINNLTTVNVVATEENLIGFQFALEFDPATYQFEGVEAGQIDLSSSNLGLTRLNEGLVTISWNSNQSFETDGSLISLLLTKVGNKDAAVQVNPGIITPEAYSVQGEVNTHTIEFRTQDYEVVGSNFELFQNIPNPFDNSTRIGFNLDKDSNTTLKVFDYSGKLLIQKSGAFKKGYNSFDIHVDELNASGVMYYQIETDTQYASRKMIVIK